MKSTNIPEVKLGIVAVSRDCFPIQLSEKRRAAIVAACQAKGLDLYEAKTTVENEKDMEKAVAEVTEAGCNALTVFLGNFGPETPETLIAKFFNGPCMFVAAAEGDGDMINGRGDAYCGMLNCSYNLGMRHLKGYIPEYPIGTADEIADKMIEFVPIARTLLGVRDLKIITFGPRPQDFFACNAPIKGLYELGVEVEENSELDLLVSYKEHANDPRIEDVCKDMAAEMGEGHYYPDLLARMAQFELTLLDWADAHKGSKKYVAFADKCWPAFPSQFGFEPCYVNSRLVSRGIPVSCEVDIYGALSEYIGMCASGDTVTLLDINNSVPQYIYDEDIAGKFDYSLPIPSWASTAATLRPARCAMTVPLSISSSSTVCWSRPAAIPTSPAAPWKVTLHLLTSPSTVCSATARVTCAPTLQRARSCLLLPAPSAALQSSASMRWAVSTAMFWSRSVTRTTAPLHSVITARSCLRSSSSWAFRISLTTSPRACRTRPRIRLLDLA